MKRIIRIVSLMLIIVMLSSTAMAANIYNFKTEKNALASLKLSPKNYSGDSVKFTTAYVGNDTTKAQCVFEDVVKFDLSFLSTEGAKDYVVFMLANGDTVPKQENIVYINQNATNAKQEFCVYPSDLDPGTYNFYISSDKDSFVKIGSLTVTDAALTDPGFKLGDPDRTNKVDTNDALWALKVLVGIIKPDQYDNLQKSAADTNGDGKVDTTDALNMLKYLVGIIEAFER